MEDGRISAIAPAASADDGLLMLPALVDAHDHGRGLRTLATGAVDQPLELWLPWLGQEPYVDPYLRAAVAFARNARSGIAAINHCHNPQRVSEIVEEAEAVVPALPATLAFAWHLPSRCGIAITSRTVVRQQ